MNDQVIDRDYRIERNGNTIQYDGYDETTRTHYYYVRVLYQEIKDITFDCPRKAARWFRENVG